MAGYMVVNASTLRGLESLVSDRMAEGWRPIGGVSVSVSWDEEWQVGDYTKRRMGTTLYAQAMTRSTWRGWIARWLEVRRGRAWLARTKGAQ